MERGRGGRSKETWTTIGLLLLMFRALAIAALFSLSVWLWYPLNQHYIVHPHWRDLPSSSDAISCIPPSHFHWLVATRVCNWVGNLFTLPDCVQIWLKKFKHV